MSDEEPITPGCPSLMPHNLPGGFDGVEPGEVHSRNFHLGETSEKIKLHLSKKYFNAALGLAAGIVSLPLMIVGWPFCLAYFLYNEIED